MRCPERDQLLVMFNQRLHEMKVSSLKGSRLARIEPWNASEFQDLKRKIEMLQVEMRVIREVLEMHRECHQC